MFIRYAFTTGNQAQSIPPQLPNLFTSKEQALYALQDAIENMAIHEDDVQNWELVEMQLVVLQNAIAKHP